MLNLLVIIALAAGCCYAFSPYHALRYRSVKERWTTRERSFGWPYYYKMKYGETCNQDCGDPAGGCRREGWEEKHVEAYNRQRKDMYMDCHIVQEVFTTTVNVVGSLIIRFLLVIQSILLTITMLLSMVLPINLHVLTPQFKDFAQQMLKYDLIKEDDLKQEFAPPSPFDLPDENDDDDRMPPLIPYELTESTEVDSEEQESELNPETEEDHKDQVEQLEQHQEKQEDQLDLENQVKEQIDPENQELEEESEPHDDDHIIRE